MAAAIAACPASAQVDLGELEIVGDQGGPYSGDEVAILFMRVRETEKRLETAQLQGDCALVRQLDGQILSELIGFVQDHYLRRIEAYELAKNYTEAAQMRQYRRSAAAMLERHYEILARPCSPSGSESQTLVEQSYPEQLDEEFEVARAAFRWALVNCKAASFDIAKQRYIRALAREIGEAAERFDEDMRARLGNELKRVDAMRPQACEAEPVPTVRQTAPQPSPEVDNRIKRLEAALEIVETAQAQGACGPYQGTYDAYLADEHTRDLMSTDAGRAFLRRVAEVRFEGCTPARDSVWDPVAPVPIPIELLQTASLPAPTSSTDLPGPATGETAPKPPETAGSLDWLVGTWRIPQGGAVGFRREADGTASAYIAETTSALAEAGYSAGLVFLRGCRDITAGNQAVWRYSANCAEGFRDTWQGGGIALIRPGEESLELPIYIGSPIAGYQKLERGASAPVGTPAPQPPMAAAPAPKPEILFYEVGWHNTASAFYPLWDKRVGEDVGVICPAEGRETSTGINYFEERLGKLVGVFGGPFYGADSYLCEAAVHRGVITRQGGQFRVRRVAYSTRTVSGSTSNGVQSQDYAGLAFMILSAD